MWFPMEFRKTVWLPAHRMKQIKMIGQIHRSTLLGISSGRALIIAQRQRTAFSCDTFGVIKSTVVAIVLISSPFESRVVDSED